MGRLILFLVRIKLRLKPYQRFIFVGQKNPSVYYFTKTNIMKSTNIGGKEIVEPSGVSLNWLIDKNCKVKIVA